MIGVCGHLRTSAAPYGGNGLSHFRGLAAVSVVARQMAWVHESMNDRAQQRAKAIPQDLNANADEDE